jgi:hypothetical protein
MAERTGIILATMAGIVAASLLAPMSAHAIEVKKDLYTGNGGGATGAARIDPLTSAQKKELAQLVSDASDPYVSAESEKKAAGEAYIDLEGAQFNYLTYLKGDKWNVKARLVGSEYLLPKNGSGKGKPTGKLRILAFFYQLDHGKLVEAGKPQWEEVLTAASQPAK